MALRSFEDRHMHFGGSLQSGLRWLFQSSHQAQCAGARASFGRSGHTVACAHSPSVRPGRHLVVPLGPDQRYGDTTPTVRPMCSEENAQKLIIRLLYLCANPCAKCCKCLCKMTLLKQIAFSLRHLPVATNQNLDTMSEVVCNLSPAMTAAPHSLG